MKSIPVFVLAILLTACSANTEDQTGQDEDSTSQENVEADAPVINAPAIADVTIDDLVGIWEITEIRENPSVPGKPPGMLDKGIFFGFTEHGTMSTTSMGLDYLEETLDELSPKFSLENGMICGGADEETLNDLFEMQWGGCISVVLVEKNHLAIGFDRGGGDIDRYRYLTRVK